MRKVWLITKREYFAMVATKGFLIGILLVPILMGGGAVLPHLLRERGELEDKRIVVLDQSGVLGPALVEAADQWNKTAIYDKESGRQTEARYLIELAEAESITDDVRLELSDRIRRRSIHGFVEIPSEILALPVSDEPAAVRPEPPQVHFYAENAGLSDARRWLDRRTNEVVRLKRMEREGIDPRAVKRASVPLSVGSMSLYERTNSGEIKPAKPVDKLEALVLPMGVSMLMFMIIWMTAPQQVQSIMEEKSQRISEVMLGAVHPFQWMLGKLLGGVGGSLTTISIYFAAGYALAYYHGATDSIPWHVAPWFIILQILGILLFGSIFMAIGAAANSMSEAQTLLMPVMILFLLPLFVWFNVARDPGAGLATWLSFYPPGAPMIMTVRMVAPTTVPWWQPPASVAVLFLATLACLFVAGRVFRIGILSQGKTPKLRELLRWAYAA